ncbi:hypothetical protein [Jiella mangrovi]|uniref:Uncharacterized protein n=1 Tax=Jiella mangrovi TaxID=2821407 RepID=A0ABS4BH20_9HYPH|nr:hypothetical protein [Jiella mangrovi]MBP0616047.1 hypothetical protein [Jiella mangrovi]
MSDETRVVFTAPGDNFASSGAVDSIWRAGLSKNRIPLFRPALSSWFLRIVRSENRFSIVGPML